MNASFVISARLGSGVDSARIGFATDDWVTPDLFDEGSSRLTSDLIRLSPELNRVISDGWRSVLGRLTKVDVD